MTELKYDPDFPYIVRMIDGEVVSKHTTAGGAKSYLVSTLQGYGEVIDTTPKPKIPEDAEFIYYLDSGGDDQFGHRDTFEGKEIWWTGSGDYILTSEILEYIGDGEVTVLVRKEDS